MRAGPDRRYLSTQVWEVRNACYPRVVNREEGRIFALGSGTSSRAGLDGYLAAERPANAESAEDEAHEQKSAEASFN